MSKLDELIKEYCPDGVEYKTLKEIFNTRNGYTPSKSKSEYWEGDLIVPWFRMDDLRTNGNILYDSIKHVTPLAVKGNPFPKDSIIVATSATIGEHALVKVASLSNQRFTYLMLKDDYKEKYDIKFLYYYCYKLDEWCISHLNQGNFASVDMKKFNEFKFPVPPLEVQREIVRVLDKFTLLTAELTAELTARKKQYEYYRNELLSFDNTVEFKPLGELFSYIRNGFVGTVTPFFTDEEHGVRYLEGTNIHDGVISDNEVKYVTKDFHEKYKRNELKADDILMVQSGHIGECAVVGKKYAGANCHALIIMSNGGNINSRFVCHYFHSYEGYKRLKPAMTGGTVKHVLATKMKDITIPVPSMEIQDRIVRVLDDFESICLDLNIGLPAEIDARQKQYEYYRDALLTFVEKGETILTDRQTDRA